MITVCWLVAAVWWWRIRWLRGGSDERRWSRLILLLGSSWRLLLLLLRWWGYCCGCTTTATSDDERLISWGSDRGSEERDDDDGGKCFLILMYGLIYPHTYIAEGTSKWRKRDFAQKQVCWDHPKITKKLQRLTLIPISLPNRGEISSFLFFSFYYHQK